MVHGHTREVATKIAHNQRFRKVLSILVIAVLLLGGLMVPIERQAEGAKILNVGDGLWYAVTSMTGGGHGDVVPVTNLGRVVAGILQVFGVMLFGTLVAFVSVELLRYQEDFYVKRINTRIDEMEDTLVQIDKHLHFLMKK